MCPNASQVVLVVKNLSICQCRRYKTWIQFLSQEDSLKESMATTLVIFAHRIPWTEESDGYNP